MNFARPLTLLGSPDNYILAMIQIKRPSRKALQ